MTMEMAAQISTCLATGMREGKRPEDIFEALCIAVATFIAGAQGSPIDHRHLAEQFHNRVMNELPKARHRLAQLARGE
jgi:hypothetical protein